MNNIINHSLTEQVRRTVYRHDTVEDYPIYSLTLKELVNQDSKQAFKAPAAIALPLLGVIEVIARVTTGIIVGLGVSLYYAATKNEKALNFMKEKLWQPLKDTGTSTARAFLAIFGVVKLSMIHRSEFTPDGLDDAFTSIGEDGNEQHFIVEKTPVRHRADATYTHALEIKTNEVVAVQGLQVGDIVFPLTETKDYSENFRYDVKTNELYNELGKKTQFKRLNRHFYYDVTTKQVYKSADDTIKNSFTIVFDKWLHNNSTGLVYDKKNTPLPDIDVISGNYYRSNGNGVIYDAKNEAQPNLKIIGNDHYYDTSKNNQIFDSKDQPLMVDGNPVEALSVTTDRDTTGNFFMMGGKRYRYGNEDRDGLYQIRERGTQNWLRPSSTRGAYIKLNFDA